MLLNDTSGKLLKLLEFAIAREDYETDPALIELYEHDLDLEEPLPNESDLDERHKNWQLNTLIDENKTAVEECLQAVVSACKPLMPSGVFLKYERRNALSRA